MGDEMNINVKNSNVNYIIILGIFILIIVHYIDNFIINQN